MKNSKLTQTINVRVDKNLKKKFIEVCDGIGMNPTIAIRMFIKKTVSEKQIPFRLKNQ
jgi:addiction module RelB/DinJ family antitoxin